MENILLRAFDNQAPRITKRAKGKPCPWMSMDIRKTMTERDKLLRKSRKSKSENHVSGYKRLRNQVRIMIRQAKSTYNKTLLRENSSSPEAFSKSIKSIYSIKNKQSSVNRTLLLRTNKQAIHQKLQTASILSFKQLSAK